VVEFVVAVPLDDVLPVTLDGEADALKGRAALPTNT
jgi:hypothetical protein